MFTKKRNGESEIRMNELKQKYSFITRIFTILVLSFVAMFVIAAYVQISSKQPLYLSPWITSICIAILGASIAIVAISHNKKAKIHAEIDKVNLGIEVRGESKIKRK